MQIGDKVKLNKTFIDRMRYPWRELAKFRRFEVVRLPDKYGVMKLRRLDTKSKGIEYYDSSFLMPDSAPNEVHNDYSVS